MLDAISSAHPLSSYAVQLIDYLLQQAISLQASDIHRDQLIRANAVLVRLKLLSNMDITEQRRPQDGYFNHSLGDSSIDIRASCLPGHWGEKVVLRLQHPEIKQRTIHQLGLDIQQSQCLINYLQQPQGLMLITGPTGSGKSVTLHSILMHLHQPHRNLVSAEDPVEMGLDGVHQTEVNLHIDLDFSHILRSMLRQDPDVIMLGEMRDSVSADVSIKAAQTGHLVLSSLHTRSVAETINRLQGLAVDLAGLSHCLDLVVNQRLLRCLCQQCCRPLDRQQLQAFDSDEIQQARHDYQQQFGPIAPAMAIGCQYCLQGYRGRSGIFSLLALDNHMRTAIRQRQLELLQAPINLRQQGLYKVLAGMTTMAELNRVIVN